MTRHTSFLLPRLMLSRMFQIGIFKKFHSKCFRWGFSESFPQRCFWVLHTTGFQGGFQSWFLKVLQSVIKISDSNDFEITWKPHVWCFGLLQNKCFQKVFRMGVSKINIRVFWGVWNGGFHKEFHNGVFKGALRCYKISSASTDLETLCNPHVWRNCCNSSPSKLLPIIVVGSYLVLLITN